MSWSYRVKTLFSSWQSTDKDVSLSTKEVLIVIFRSYMQYSSWKKFNYKLKSLIMTAALQIKLQKLFFTEILKNKT